jgi:2-oxoglutarate ferredoxin oxidoreductase subunit beta
MSVTLEQYKNDVRPAWCPGCGNFVILDCLKRALVDLDLAPHEVIVATGIGQSAKLPHYLAVNGFNGLHGREIAAATGIKLAAHTMPVVVHAGDGGGYGEGGNHFLHAIRRNLDLTVVVHDNHYYGLTQGQVSPTACVGTTTRLHPAGVPSHPLNPLTLAISQSASWVAQGSAAHKDHLVELLKAAIVHRGFSLLNVLQPCVTYDKRFTYAYYRENCFEVGGDHDPRDRYAALSLVEAGNCEGRIPIGVIFTIERPVYEDVVLREAIEPLRDRTVDPDRATPLFSLFR